MIDKPDIKGQTEGLSCWDVQQCPTEERNSCPAYPNMGRECWKVTGTKCAQGKYEMASFAEKIMYCRNECGFYRDFVKQSYV